jgi:hypothetical protein
MQYNNEVHHRPSNVPASADWTPLERQILFTFDTSQQPMHGPSTAKASSLIYA